MARVSTYLNFPGNTEEALLFYKSVFGTEFIGPIVRFGEMPPNPGMPPLSKEDANRILHIELPILGGHVIMATDTCESMGMKTIQGNSVSINLEPDTRTETDRLYKALSAGGTIGMPLQDMFWGAYYASFTDRFGTLWMLNCANKT